MFNHSVTRCCSPWQETAASNRINTSTFMADVSLMLNGTINRDWLHPNRPNLPSLVLQLTALPTTCPCQRQHLMNLLSTMRTMWLVWGMEWRWGPWFLWMGWWGWMAGWSVKNRMRCWTWPLRWAPSCCQPSPCHLASSWINTVHASSDCWAGNQKREGN